VKAWGWVGGVVMILVNCLLMSWFFEKIVIFGFGEMAENHQKLRNIRKFRGILPKFFSVVNSGNIG